MAQYIARLFTPLAREKAKQRAEAIALIRSRTAFLGLPVNLDTGQVDTTSQALKSLGMSYQDFSKALTPPPHGEKLSELVHKYTQCKSSQLNPLKEKDRKLIDEWIKDIIVPDQTLIDDESYDRLRSHII